jgi:peptide/nickel transport system ATP-binding protein
LEYTSVLIFLILKMSQPLLEVKDLSIEFIANGHITPAVKNISFEVFPGEITAIVGESGSGKSVTSLAIMRLLPDQAKLTGRVIFSNNDGATIDLLHCAEKNINATRGKEISMIFQEPMTSLNPVFTCGFQVVEALQTHLQISASQAREKTIELFQQVNLPDPPAMLDRYPHQLSGGQKQRVMIAMAMSCNPSLLIADEPTTALDVTVQKTILELIKNLQAQTKMSVILITHDLGLVADIADKLIVMYKGEIVEQGQTNVVLNNPAHPYTRALLACRPVMHKKGARLPIVNDFLQDKFESLSNGRAISDRSTSAAGVPLSKLPTVSETVLDVQRLKVYYPGKKKLWGESTPTFKAVDNVSFVIAKGETVGLVGESGCGKTTLGRAILQLIKPTEGRILLNGIDLAGLSGAAMRSARKDLQIVFQDPYGSLNPRLTIGEAIQEPMKVHSMLNNNIAHRDKVVELLEKVNLKAEHFFRYPHQFSGGQRQRICIARALALNPSFLIFDESVSALDVSVQAQVLNLLNDLKKEFGFTSIFISHDLSVVRFISDRIIVMNKGKIVEEGAADKIYFSPENEYTKNLIEAIPGKNISLNG